MRPVAQLVGSETCHLKCLLSRAGWELLESSDPDDIGRQARRGRPAVLLVGIPDGGEAPGLDLVRRVRAQHRSVSVVVLAERGSEALAVAALRAGATDYFSRPWTPEDVLARLRRDLPQPAGQEGHRTAQPGTSRPADHLVGSSPWILALRDRIAKLAATDATVLITGETGTGKELVAELIHRTSRRSAGEFVCLNCAAIPDSLLESELFGHERGAFTGAHARQEGKLALAHGGTFMLDEVGDMSPLAQAKVLRAVETHRVHRLGGRLPVPVDVRLLAATNQDLERAVDEGRFRRDLYYRLHVARLHLVPLRDRREDIPALTGHLIQQLNARVGAEVEGVTDEVMARLSRHDWPGNVRELRNVLEGVLVTRRTGRIVANDLPAGLAALTEGGETERGELGRLLDALEATRWNKSQAARRLHWSRVTLYRKLWKYHVADGSLGLPSSGRVAERL